MNENWFRRVGWFYFPVSVIGVVLCTVVLGATFPWWSGSRSQTTPAAPAKPVGPVQVDLRDSFTDVGIVTDGSKFSNTWGGVTKWALPAKLLGPRVQWKEENVTFALGAPNTKNMVTAGGQTIGTIGSPDVNGFWPPHLHFQIITDLLDLTTEFPGVAPASQRGVWLSLCPDPNLIAQGVIALFN